MSDRAFQIGIGLSLAIHLLAAIALSSPRWATPIVPPPAQAASVRVRLASLPRADAAPEAKPPAVAAPPPPRERDRPLRDEKREFDRPKPKPVVEANPEAPAPPREDPAAQTLAAVSRTAPPSETATEAGAPGPIPATDLPSARRSDEDVPSRLARYVEEVRARIEARKRYPAMARKRSVEGRVVARVGIRADGRVSAIEFDGGAPALLRRATDDAIRSAAPYPAPPAGALTIELPVDYSLGGAS